MTRMACILFAATIICVMACQEEEIQSGFTTTTGTAKEGDGIQSVVIDLGQTTTQSTTITFQLGGDAGLDGDYKLKLITAYGTSLPMSITVPAGESTATINFELIDDNQIEPTNEIIYFEITSVSDEDIANSMRHTLLAFEIEDNDSAPGAGMQVDLSWNLGDGVRVNTSNFDLYLASSITLKSNGELDTFEKVESLQSINERGFETYVVPENLSDQEYYIIIAYVSGTSDARVELQMTQGSDSGAATGRIGSNYVGRYVYYGPITKSANTFTFR